MNDPRFPCAAPQNSGSYLEGRAESTGAMKKSCVGYHVIIFQKGVILCSEPARY